MSVYFYLSTSVKLSTHISNVYLSYQACYKAEIKLGELPHGAGGSSCLAEPQ